MKKLLIVSTITALTSLASYKELPEAMKDIPKIMTDPKIMLDDAYLMHETNRVEFVTNVINAAKVYPCPEPVRTNLLEKLELYARSITNMYPSVRVMVPQSEQPRLLDELLKQQSFQTVRQAGGQDTHTLTDEHNSNIFDDELFPGLRQKLENNTDSKSQTPTAKPCCCPPEPKPYCGQY